VEPPTTTTSSTTTTTTTLPGETSCGDPVALVVSRDTGFSADAITASDALNTLRQAVGLGGVLDCPACP
jgi:hypothetical protein